MIKLFKWLFAITTLFVVIYLLSSWWKDRNYFESGESGKFTVGVGETFKIQLHHNGSTGYENCWLNISHCDNVALHNESYSNSFMAKAGYIGSGGRIVFEFKGIKKGIDTIAMASCPTGPDGKDCSAYSMEKPDNIFIINVEDED